MADDLLLMSFLDHAAILAGTEPCLENYQASSIFNDFVLDSMDGNFGYQLLDANEVAPSPEEPFRTPSPASSSTSKVSKPKRSGGSKTTAEASSVCANCGSRSSPIWRRSADRKSRLCNACGLYEKQHSAPRPLTVRKQTTNPSSVAKKAEKMPMEELLKLHATLREQLEVVGRVIAERESADEEETSEGENSV